MERIINSMPETEKKDGVHGVGEVARGARGSGSGDSGRADRATTTLSSASASRTADLVDEKNVGVALVAGEADLGEKQQVGVESVAAMADFEETSGVEEKDAVLPVVAALMDVVVKPALVDVQDVEPLKPTVEVAEGSVVSGSNKRKLEYYKLEDYLDPYVDVSDVSDPSSVEYDSQDSGETIDSMNVASFTRKTVNKLQDEGTSAYLKRGKYVCPWHCTKPRGGLREGLVQHVRALAHGGESARERANHAAMLNVLEPDDEPEE